MQRLIITLLLLLNLKAYTQTYKFYQTDNIHNQLRLNSKTGEVNQIQSDGQTFLVHAGTTLENEKPNRYILHKTKNMWTYILLDQVTGKLWQCQYSVKGTEYISSWKINTIELSNSEKNVFSIQPRTSMYQFYLTNDETGEMWQFQWSTKGDEYRWIKKVN